MDLVSAAGLVFQTWMNNTPYYPNALCSPDSDLYAPLNALPEPRLWATMERLLTFNGTHQFIACRPDRPKERYTIDFSTDDCLDYVPQFRIGCGIADGGIFRPNWSIGLNDGQLIFLQYVDGRRTIREIAACVAQSDAVDEGDTVDLQQFACELVHSLWRLDFLAMGLGASTS